MVEREWLAAQLEAGRSMEAIAREVGRNPSTVSYWVKKHGLRSRHAYRRATGVGVARDRLEALVVAGMSTRKIAESLEVSQTTVRYWLKRYGLETTEVARRRMPRERLTGVCATHGVTEYRSSGGRLMCGKCRAGAVSEWRRRAKRILVDDAGGGCALCGYDRCVAALQFHHVDPSTKRFGLGSRGLAQALDKLREEARKCVLLCANCHAEVEAGVAELPFQSLPRESGGSPRSGVAQSAEQSAVNR